MVKHVKQEDLQKSGLTLKGHAHAKIIKKSVI